MKKEVGQHWEMRMLAGLVLILGWGSPAGAESLRQQWQRQDRMERRDRIQQDKGFIREDRNLRNGFRHEFRETKIAIRNLRTERRQAVRRGDRTAADAIQGEIRARRGILTAQRHDLHLANRTLNHDRAVLNYVGRGIAPPWVKVPDGYTGKWEKVAKPASKEYRQASRAAVKQDRAYLKEDRAALKDAKKNLRETLAQVNADIKARVASGETLSGNEKRDMRNAALADARTDVHNVKQVTGYDRKMLNRVDRPQLMRDRGYRFVLKKKDSGFDIGGAIIGGIAGGIRGGSAGAGVGTYCGGSGKCGPLSGKF